MNAAGIALLFIFWFFVGVFAPESKSIPVAVPASTFSVYKERLTYGLELVGFVWFIVNLILPALQGWLISPEWVSYSSIFWWISFVGGASGLFALVAVKKLREKQKRKLRALGRG